MPGLPTAGRILLTFQRRSERNLAEKTPLLECHLDRPIEVSDTRARREVNAP
jgi:hypothetical protein